jgi:hypothetical protein
MDLHAYTRELLDKNLLPELKEIAQALGIIPEGNKTRRETWVAALVGQPFPVFQSIASEEPTKKSLDVDFNVVRESTPAVVCKEGIYELVPEPPDPSEFAQTIPFYNALADYYEWYPADIYCDGKCKFNAKIFLRTERSLRIGIDYCPTWDDVHDRRKNSPGVEVDPVEEPLIETVENPPGVESNEFPDLESALAEIARLRAQNDKLLELARFQSEIIRKAKDISPVERPSFKRVLALAQAACLDISKALTGGWLLTMGEKLKRGFKTLKEIWELLTVDDWHLTDLFCPPPKEPVSVAPLLAPIRSKYSAVPFCDDDLIDIWSLGINAVSSGRLPPAGGEAM